MGEGKRMTRGRGGNVNNRGCISEQGKIKKKKRSKEVDKGKGKRE